MPSNLEYSSVTWLPSKHMKSFWSLTSFFFHLVKTVPWLLEARPPVPLNILLTFFMHCLAMHFCSNQFLKIFISTISVFLLLWASFDFLWITIWLYACIPLVFYLLCAWITDRWSDTTQTYLEDNMLTQLMLKVVFWASVIHYNCNLEAKLMLGEGII